MDKYYVIKHKQDNIDAKKIEDAIALTTLQNSSKNNSSKNNSSKNNISKSNSQKSIKKNIF